MKLDIVIPAFNEERRIDRTLRVYRSAVTEPESRFLVALDSCTDLTADVVRRHADVDPRVSLLEFGKLGKGGVIMESFRHCDADIVGFVDADCATPPAEFLRLVEMTRRADGAIASRAHPTSVLPTRRPATRLVSSWAFARLTRLLFGLPYRDTQCGAKVLRRHVVERILPLLSSRDFLFDVDLLLTASRLGYRIVEVPTVWLDQQGSHLSAGSDARRMVLSSLRLWLHHRVLPVTAAGAAPPAAEVRHPVRASPPDTGASPQADGLPLSPSTGPRADVEVSLAGAGAAAVPSSGAA